MLRKLGLAIVSAALVFAASFDAEAYQIRVSADGVNWTTSAVYNADAVYGLGVSVSPIVSVGSNSSISNLNSYVNFENNSAWGIAVLYAQITESFSMDGWSPSASVLFSNNLTGAGPTSAFMATYFGSTAYSTANLIASSGVRSGSFSTSILSSPVAGLLPTNTPFFLTNYYELALGAGNSLDALSQVFVTAIPEPGTIVLLGIGMLGLAVFGKRRMKQAK